MGKDFEIWNVEKILIHHEGQRPFFHEREVWWSALGANVGYEQDGKGTASARPILVFKKFNNEVFWGIPLTLKNKHNKFHAPIHLSDGIKRRAILSQLRLMDAKRLIDKTGTISRGECAAIQKAVIALIEQ